MESIYYYILLTRLLPIEIVQIWFVRSFVCVFCVFFVSFLAPSVSCVRFLSSNFYLEQIQLRCETGACVQWTPLPSPVLTATADISWKFSNEIYTLATMASSHIAPPCIRWQSFWQNNKHVCLYGPPCTWRIERRTTEMTPSRSTSHRNDTNLWHLRVYTNTANT